MPHWLQITGKTIEAVESEFKNAFEIAHRFRRGVDRHRAECVRKTPKIVEPHDVIGVRMRKDYRIEPPNIFAQNLSAKILAGIQTPRAFGSLNVNRRTQPLVARIGRMADFAIATDHRHALRSAGTEKGEAKLRVASCELRV